ncbi:EP1-like glycoprotein 2 [Carex rostrata]
MASQTSSLAFVAVLLLCFSFSVNPQPYNYPTASAPASWTNSPSLLHNFTYDGGEIVRSVLLQLNSTQGMSFATGFYCFPPCKSFFLSIYIVYASNHDEGYATSHPPQVIWSANRARPVSENATLQLTSKDGLTLHDNDGTQVWSTSRLNKPVDGISITESGNLVLFDKNNFTIWQSFDHPTDCLVMWETLAPGMKIIANSSSTDLAESQLYLTLLDYGLFGFANYPLIYYSRFFENNYISNGTVYEPTFIKFMNGSLTVFYRSLEFHEVILTFPLAKSIEYMRLESNGHLRLYEFYENSTWTMVADLFHIDNCDYPTACGN